MVTVYTSRFNANAHRFVYITHLYFRVIRAINSDNLRIQSSAIRLCNRSELRSVNCIFVRDLQDGREATVLCENTQLDILFNYVFTQLYIFPDHTLFSGITVLSVMKRTQLTAV